MVVRSDVCTPSGLSWVQSFRASLSTGIHARRHACIHAVGAVRHVFLCRLLERGPHVLHRLHIACPQACKVWPVPQAAPTGMPCSPPYFHLPPTVIMAWNKADALRLKITRGLFQPYTFVIRHVRSCLDKTADNRFVKRTTSTTWAGGSFTPRLHPCKRRNVRVGLLRGGSEVRTCGKLLVRTVCRTVARDLA